MLVFASELVPTLRGAPIGFCWRLFLRVAGSVVGPRQTLWEGVAGVGRFSLSLWPVVALPLFDCLERKGQRRRPDYSRLVRRIVFTLSGAVTVLLHIRTLMCAPSFPDCDVASPFCDRRRNFGRTFCP